MLAAVSVILYMLLSMLWIVVLCWLWILC